MRYEGPIYRPPSEAASLLVQATVGCPHNQCSFCLVYKKGPRFRVRPLEELLADLAEAAGTTAGPATRSIFLPAGDSLAMPTAQLAAVCRRARELFPRLERITTYASVRSLLAQGEAGLKELAEAGLGRLHLGLESGHAPTLLRVKKGCTPEEQVRAGRLALAAGLELSLYVILGLAGPRDSRAHAEATAEVINRISAAGRPVVRLRTLVPKAGTPLLHQIERGRFTLLTPHEVLAEARILLEGLTGPLALASDHYSNYLELAGELPADRARLLELLASAARLPRQAFRPDFVGTQ